jgi:hypothetical protein
MCGVSAKNRKYHLEEKVMGIELGGVTKVYPFSGLKKIAFPIKDFMGKTLIQIFYDHKTKTVVIWDENNREVSAIVGFWFALKVFHPETHTF